MELADGQRTVIGSDASWKCETGPILASDFMMGEIYDARRERQGWDRPEFDDHHWLPSVEVRWPKVQIPQFGASNNEPQESDQDLPLVAQVSEPVRVAEHLTPISVQPAPSGEFIYDLGQNFAGWVKIAVAGARGTKIQLRHGEQLNPDGSLYTDNLRRAAATDIYVLKGAEEGESWQPRFTFHGFRYVEISGLASPLPLDRISGCVVMSATTPTGDFECSHPLVNQLWKNALWSQKGNFLSVPTDCPQRDERLGWMGDAQVFLRTATYNMDVAAFFTKWMMDVTDSQDVDGIFPDVAPRVREDESFCGLDGLGGSAGWADAGIIVPWTMWRVYGDRRMIERHWQSMVRWLDWLEATNPSGIREHQLGNNYGDWLCIPADTSFRTHSEMKTLLATAYWADDAAKMARMAEVVDEPVMAQRFEAMSQRVREKFQERWLLADGRLTVETQTAYLLALAFHLLPEKIVPLSVARLVDMIRNNGWHLSTGFIGIRYLNPILTEHGHADVAYRLLCNEDYPSWLYPIRHGATTIWERWNGWTEESGFFDPQMNSFNHYALGSVCEWLYRHVAGIELDDEVAGFKRFVIKPFIDRHLTHAGARYRSMQGTIESRWEWRDSKLRLMVRVPANTTARVFFPCHSLATLRESGLPIAESEDVELLQHDGVYAVLAIPAGRYEFANG